MSGPRAPTTSPTMGTSPVFFFSSRRRHTRLQGDWSSDVCSSDLFAVRQVDLPERSPLTHHRVLTGDAVHEHVEPTMLLLDPGKERMNLADDQIGRASCRERV